MNFESAERYGISVRRLAAASAGASAAVAGGTSLLAGGVLGQATAPVAVVLAALAFYSVASAPRRLRDRERVSQARDSVLLLASARACLGATGSRAKTLLILRPRERTLADGVGVAGRRVLLGTRVEDALGSAAVGLSSYSASQALGSIAELRPESFDAGDEESRGLASSDDLSRETKLPLFMTVCFFAPIMLTLYAVFTHAYSPSGLAELVGLEFVAVDLAFYLTAYDRGRP